MRLKDALGVGDAARDQRGARARAGPRAGSRPACSTPRPPSIAWSRRYAPDDAVATRILSEPFLRQPFRDASPASWSTWPSSGSSRWPARAASIGSSSTRRRRARRSTSSRRRRASSDSSRAGPCAVALRPWFDDQGHLRGDQAVRDCSVGSSRHWFDRVVGLGLLRDMAEFFLSFGPMYEGFRQRAQAVNGLLTAPGTVLHARDAARPGAHARNPVLRAAARGERPPPGTARGQHAASRRGEARPPSRDRRRRPPRSCSGSANATRVGCRPTVTCCLASASWISRCSRTSRPRSTRWSGWQTRSSINWPGRTPPEPVPAGRR